MKARLAVAAALVVVAVALVVVALAGRGVPWGFRGHQAVLLEAAGTVEVQASEARSQREQREDAALLALPGLFLDEGDEVRVGRYSEARLKLPVGGLVLGDDARVTLDSVGLTVLRGAVEVELSAGVEPFPLKVPALDVTVLLQPGPEGAAVRALFDGKSDLRLFVHKGSASLGEVSAEPGKLLVVTGEGAPVVAAPDEKYAPRASCAGQKVTATVPAGSQVYAARQIFYPEAGKVVVELPEPKASVAVFARSVTGAVWFETIRCAGGRSR